MIVQRTETHVIKESDHLYRWILEECFRSKILFNKALYIYRQAFTEKHENISDYVSIVNNKKFISSYNLITKMLDFHLEFCYNIHVNLLNES